MRLIVILAVLSGLLLALFLWLRPAIGSMGTPTPPEVSGYASPVPAGTARAASAGPPASTLGTSIPRPQPGDAAKASITHNDEMERAILESVNQERAKVGANPLQPDDELRDTAREHSDDMFIRGFFNHDDPDGWSPMDRVADAHRHMIGLAGENIWMGVNLDLSDAKKVAAQIMNDWMRSRGHKENILKKDYTHLGVGIAIRGQEARATQNFGAIHALTQQAVPQQARAGDRLDLTTKPVGVGPAPDRFEFFSSDKGMAFGGMLAIPDAVVPEPAALPAGIYRLRFLFPHGIAYWGPRIEIK